MYLSKNRSSFQYHTFYVATIFLQITLYFPRCKYFKKIPIKKDQIVCDIKCLVVQVAAAAITMPSFVSTLKRLLVIIRWLLVV